MANTFGGLYDIVLAFKGGKDRRPTIKELLDGKMFSAHVYIRRIPFNQVPQEQEQAVKFLYDMYARKVNFNNYINQKARTQEIVL